MILKLNIGDLISPIANSEIIFELDKNCILSGVKNVITPKTRAIGEFLPGQLGIVTMITTRSLYASVLTCDCFGLIILNTNLSIVSK